MLIHGAAGDRSYTDEKRTHYYERCSPVQRWHWSILEFILAHIKQKALCKITAVTYNFCHLINNLSTDMCSGKNWTCVCFIDLSVVLWFGHLKNLRNYVNSNLFLYHTLWDGSPALLSVSHLMYNKRQLLALTHPKKQATRVVNNKEEQDNIMER